MTGSGAAMSVGQTIIDETTLLANAIRTAPGARVRKYPSWNLAQLGRHVGEIQGWVTGIVRDGASERPPRSKLTDVPDHDVPGALHVSAAALAAALDSCDPAAPVWTFAGDGTNGFWCRRMVNEATIHRWDAQDAIGKVTDVPEDVARDGIDECVSVYLAPALPDWTLEHSETRLTASDGTGTCTVNGDPLEMWLFVMGRRGLHGLNLDGDESVAAGLVAAIAGVRGPA